MTNTFAFAFGWDVRKLGQLFCAALILVVLSTLTALSGCASGPLSDRTGDPRDPWEPMNRKVWAFNEAVDDAVFKPVASAYKEVVPSLVRTGVNNFFGNLSDAWSLVNSVLQLKIGDAAATAVRLGINTTFGLGGVLDIASEMNIPRRKQDFGQTLGRWGVGPGPYLILPLLGPSTLRDTAAMSVNSLGDPVTHWHDVPLRNSAYAVRVIDTRARLLGATSVLEGAALDRYSFARDVFLQIRDPRPEGDSENDPEPEPDNGDTPSSSVSALPPSEPLNQGAELSAASPLEKDQHAKP